MSTFSESWVAFMHSAGFPVPDLQDTKEALDFLHKLHNAWESAGGGEELTIGALLVAGAKEMRLTVYQSLVQQFERKYLSATASSYENILDYTASQEGAEELTFEGKAKKIAATATAKRRKELKF